MRSPIFSRVVTTAAVLLAGFACVAPHAGAAEEAGAESGFKSLFNGKDLSEWQGDMKYWRVEDGAITGETTAENKAAHNTFLFYTGGGETPKSFGDFELRLKFKLRNHNSGVQYRSKQLEDFVASGYQADIAEGKPSKYTGILYEEKGRGILAQRGERVTVEAGGKKSAEKLGDEAAVKELGEGLDMEAWNDYVITAKGNRLTHAINGKTMVEVTDNDDAKAAKAGVIALQIHTGPAMKVQFKDVRIKEMGGEGGAKPSATGLPGGWRSRGGGAIGGR